MARTRGPVAEMMLEAGFPPDHVRRACRAFFGTDPDMPFVVGRDVMNRALVESELALAQAGHEITFQVRVFSSNKDVHKSGRGPQYEHLVEVLAHDPQEAELIALQMASCHPDDPMPVSSEVITDSTLCVF